MKNMELEVFASELLKYNFKIYINIYIILKYILNFYNLN